MNRLLRTVAVVLFTGGLLASTAHADLTWSATQTLSSDGTNGSGPAIAFDATGGAVAAWLETDNGHNRVHVATRAPGGFLGPSTTVSAAGVDASGVRVVVARDGAAYVLWGQSEATGADIYVLSRPAGGAFGQAENATETDGRASLGDAVVNNTTDRLLMAYSQIDVTAGPNPQIEERTKTKTPTGLISGFTKLWEGTASQSFLNPFVGDTEIAMEADGDALVAWDDNPDGSNQDGFPALVHASRLNANGTVETAQQVGQRGTGRQVSDVHVSINATRSAVFWTRALSGAQAVAEYATRNGASTGAWSATKPRSTVTA